MNTGDKVFYCILGSVCVALAYLVLRDIWRKPDYTVTRQMIERAEMEAFFGPDYEFLDDDEDEDLDT